MHNKPRNIHARQVPSFRFNGLTSVSDTKEKLLREKLETLIDEMLHKGIHFNDIRHVVEKRVICNALIRKKGNLIQTAKLLGIHRNTLSRKIDSFQINRRNTIK